MVDVLGHLALGLLCAAPAWFLFEGRASPAFVGLVLSAAMVPDVDLYLPWVIHHGVTHTVAFVVFVSLVAAALLVSVALPALERWHRRHDELWEPPPSLYAFGVGALLVGGLSHVAADMLSTSVSGLAVEPFWPFFEKPFSVYVIESYSAPRWNGVPFLAAMLVHVVLYVRSGASMRLAPDGQGSSR